MASSSLVVSNPTFNADHGEFNFVAGNQYTTNYLLAAPDSAQGNRPLPSPRFVNDVPVDFLSIHFTGRGNELDFLKESFNNAQGDVPRRCAVHGMPGIGKTQLMLRYAKLSFDQTLYSHTFWISSTTVEKLTQGIANILDLVGHPGRTLREQSAKLTAARLGLEESHEHGCTSWLLIVDNVDRSTLGFLRTHLPRRNPRGNILFTTRTADVAQALVNAAGEQHRTLELRALELRDTTHLLFEDAGIDAASATPFSYDQAEVLVKSVGLLPLAVAQAGSFMKQTHTTLDDMLILYKTEEKIEVIRWENDLTPYEERSVAATFVNQFERLSQESHDTSNLLKLLSFLDPESIQLEMIVEGARVWLQGLQSQPTQESSHPKRTISQKIKEWGQKRMRGFGHTKVHTGKDEPQIPSEFDSLVTLILSPTNFRNAIQMLQNLSLVEHQSNMGMSILRMHDLIQFMMQEGARKEESYGEWLRSSVSFVCTAFRQIENPEWPQWWDECEKFMPHVRSLNERLDSMRATNVELSWANNWLARYLFGRGRYDEAEALCKKALGDLEKELGVDHEGTLTTMNGLAFVYHVQGRYYEAGVLFKRALSMMEKYLGADHPYTLAMVDNLGRAYCCQGRYDDAEELHKRALTGKEKYMGVDHIDTMATMDNLGLVYKLQGRYAKAEALYQRALAGNEKMLGYDHPETLTVVTNLGNVYASQKRFYEAEELLKRALAGLEKQMGVDHPETLKTATSLGLVYESQERFDEAEVLFKRALSGGEKRLGENHTDTLRNTGHLARIYRLQGRSEDADALSARGQPYGIG